MRLFRGNGSSWLLFLATAGSVACSAQEYDAEDDVEMSSQRFIVTLDPQITPSLADFKKHLEEQGIDYKIFQDYTTIAPDVYYGASVILGHSEDVAKMGRSNHVQKMSPVTKVRSMAPVTERILTSPAGLKSNNYPPHLKTNITELHKMGFYGQGIKIAIIDSGVDCAHEALGGGFGEGYKISFGRDLVGDDYDGNNEIEPNDTPCTPCGYHGTHVSGIIGAQDVGYGFTGVAPNATLGMYRIFSCKAELGTNNDLVMSALLHAHKDGADIISASIGGSGGWGYGEAVLDVVNNLVTKKNATIFLAAGNEGEEGLFSGSSPAGAANSIAVGSVDSELTASQLITSTGREINYFTAQPYNDTLVFPVYRTANSSEAKDDACEQLPDSTPDLGKYIVLIRRGTCFFVDKVKNAKAKGAKQIMFYMNSTSNIQLEDRVTGVRIFTVNHTDGDYIYKESEKDSEEFRIKFPPVGLFYLPTPDTGFMSNFSQYGPNFDSLSPEPAVSGVGGNVFSTFPVRNGSYAVLSGTSMATPQMAGIAALIMQVNGKGFRGNLLRNRLASTARVLLQNHNSSIVETVVHQGGGLVNAYCAVFAKAILSTSALALNDSRHFNGSQKFEVTNTGNESIQYTLEHLAAGSAYTFTEESPYGPLNHPMPLKLNKEVATVQISPSTLTVGPGETATVQGTDRLMREYIAEKRPTLDQIIRLVIYQGFAPNDPKTNETYRLPQIGYKFLNQTLNSTNEKGEFLWDRSDKNTSLIRYRTNFGTPHLRMLLVAAEENDVQNVTKMTFNEGASPQLNISEVDEGDSPTATEEGSTTETKNSTSGISRFPRRTSDGLLLLGEIPDSESLYSPRSGSKLVWMQKWNGTLSTVTNSTLEEVPDGRYKVLIQALRVFGNRDDPLDCENWLSPVIVIKS
ncbi:subtilisin protease [Melampsora larici-populina 98AG31]|uniref:Subtilisin protease n=1 Tax=Melampsora larici-populina (strain 98AG31 / pathotype 3-4-7) TaxID=747676 RepID=F4RKP7_MELLP|nr:subtilisin protease [Melampsora larici-populina 98AG31]EGG07127.1 subtilisin protease [Melampsora larici-populina 98AG31]